MCHETSWLRPPEPEEPHVLICVKCGHSVESRWVSKHKPCPFCKDYTDFVDEEEYDKSLGEE